MPDEKECFLLCPIGRDGSPERRRADNLLEYVVKPAVQGYHVVRADDIDNTGRVTSQIIEHVRDAAIVVADLTGSNENVMYELVLRHVAAKPVVLLRAIGQQLPFDISQDRAIDLDMKDLGPLCPLEPAVRRRWAFP